MSSELIKNKQTWIHRIVVVSALKAFARRLFEGLTFSRGALGAH